ncbi:MAG TPA: Uma2 family endonuclease [Isosphaeraceae bacterium]|jgi:Uma2 family endonuclease
MANPESATVARLRLGPDDHGRLVTDEEFAEADYAEPWKYERVEGRLAVMFPDGHDHAVSSEPWRDALVLYKKLNRPDLVQIIKSEAWVRVPGGTDRIGDIGVYLVTDRPTPKIPDRVPDLMFEIVSAGRESHDRDYVAKRADYHRMGVREYVIIDRFTGRVTVLTHAPGAYEQRVLAPPETYTSPLLPGLVIPLAEVFGN